MTIQEMHYDLKTKVNKIDSQQNRNLLIPELDWALNEAQELFIQWVAEPRNRSYLGFEKSQRNTEDIKSLVKKPDQPLVVINNIVTLPEDYLYFVRGRVYMSKGSCNNIIGTLFVRQHDDEFELSPFDTSSFEWRTVNGVFESKGLRLYTDGTFTVDSLDLTYIREPLYMHNAQSFSDGGYRLPSGVLLQGSQNCELPNSTHRQIVDIASLIITGNIQAPDYELKLNKLRLNELK